MTSSDSRAPTEFSILQRVVARNRSATLFESSAREILRHDFDRIARKRMKLLAAKNRAGKLNRAEEEELDGFIRVGQALGTLKSKARRILKCL